ncbi:MAG: ROK family protein [Rhodothalassiaceae bacterium]
MAEAPLVGAVEIGGTKIICLVGSGPDDIRAEVRLPTRGPGESIADILTFFRQQATLGPLARLGVASFGPVDLDPASPRWGHITATPKAGWSDTDLAGVLARELSVSVQFDTDVNGAALAEGRWGAAKGLADYVYVTVGTGIGGGIVVNGRLVRGTLHPEIGHMVVPHDRTADPYAGCCPFHSDCLEGLASGPAIAARWGAPGAELAPDHPAWALEADYLSVLAANLLFLLAPERILFGGGVMENRWLLDLVRKRTGARLGGYLRPPAPGGGLDCVIGAPGLGQRVGPLGALALALSGDDSACSQG